MNTLFLSAILAFCVSGVSQAIGETKQQKIEQLFELTNDKQMYMKVYEPLFTSVSITDENVKKTAIDKFFVALKQDYVVAYDTFFTEVDIEEMLKYYGSATGKKVMATALEVATHLQKAYGNMMNIVQELVSVQEKAAGVIKSTAVIHFDDVAKGKNDAEIRELFAQEIQHDGLTIVKFSAFWCPPCKAYAPIFQEVAQELKELLVDGKKVSVKYVAVDIDAVQIIAQDYSVTSIPTTIFIKNGKNVDAKAGGLSKDILSARISELAK